MHSIMQKISGLFLCSLFFVTSVDANTFATIDRSQLTDVSLSSDTDFDLASQKELLTFAHLLLKSEQLSIDDFASKLSLSTQRINMQSIKQVTDKFWQLLLSNYQLASQQTLTLNEFRNHVGNYTPDSIREQFHQTYLYEQLRLAALFPKVSSEIAVFSDDEIQGQQLADKTFIFTFDDGPSQVNSNTDKLLAVLEQHNTSAVFFVLGEKFSDRLKKSSADQLKRLYQNQCVASHGWTHKSHASWNDWQKSILDTQTLLQKDVGEYYAPLFRPPYGQRKADSDEFFNQQQIKVMLWNIDSQDWSSSITSQQAGDRVLTLMLLWRKGIILFHDIHAKAQIAVPTILDSTKQANIDWLNCREL